MAFTLRLFGGAALEGERGPLTGPAVSRSRLALLALLAVARSPLSRDKLISLLWPEADTEQARHRLRESLYVLRKALGEQALLGAGDDVRLNGALVSSDVKAFEGALERKDLESAVRLYAGAFLDGFYLSGTQEFERWAEAERERLARAYAGALERLAERSEPREAVEWLRHLAAHDPYSSRVALRLMEALSSAGDPAGAIQHARLHATLLREVLNTDPDPRVSALAERLRRRSEAPAPTPAEATLGAHAPAPESRLPPIAPEPPLPSGPDPDAGAGTMVDVRSPAKAPPLRRDRPALRRRLIALGIFLLLAAGPAFLRWGADPAPSPSPTRIAVLPFNVQGDPRFAYLGEGMVDLLSGALDGAGSLRSVDPRAVLAFVHREGVPRDASQGRAVAARFGAGLFVRGSIVEAGGRLQAEASLYDARGELRALVRTTAAEGEEGVFELVDELSRHLLLEQYAGPRARLVQLAARTTSSLPALKAYLEGERHFREGHFEAAYRAYERAIAEDSLFALAHYKLSVASEWTIGFGVSVELARRAMRHSDRLPPTYQELLRAQLAYHTGPIGEAQRVYSWILHQYPDDVETLFRLGELLYHTGATRGHSITQAHQVWERVLLHEPENRQALLHLARIFLIEGERAEFDSLATRFLGLQSSGGGVLEMRLLRALVRDDHAATERLIEGLRTEHDDQLSLLVWKVAMLLSDFQTAERLARLLAGPSRSFNHGNMVWLMAAKGRWSVAKEPAGKVEWFSPDGAVAQLASIAVLPFLQVPRVDLEAIHHRVVSWDPASADVSSPWPFVQLRPYLLARLDIALGNYRAALRRASELERLDGPAEVRTLLPALAAEIRAEVALARGSAADALAEIQHVHPEAGMDFVINSPHYALSDLRFLRARALDQLGRDEEALRWYTTFAESQIGYDLPYLAPSHLARARIHERRGERAEAVEHYRKFVELWEECDPQLRPVVEEARERLAKLTGG